MRTSPKLLIGAVLGLAAEFGVLSGQLAFAQEPVERTAPSSVEIGASELVLSEQDISWAVTRSQSAARGPVVVARSSGKLLLIGGSDGGHIYAETERGSANFEDLGSIYEFNARSQDPQQNSNFTALDAKILSDNDGIVSLVITFPVLDAVNSCVRIAVGVFEISLNDAGVSKLNDPILLPRCSPLDVVQPAGGRLALRPDGTLLMTTGFMNDPIVAQNQRSPLGSLLEINLRSREIRQLAKGLRSPQGLLLLDDSHVLIADHGSSGGDELNLWTKKGQDFGWPFVGLGRRYAGTPFPLVENFHEGFRKPVVSWGLWQDGVVEPNFPPSQLAQIPDEKLRWGSLSGSIVLGSLGGQAISVLRRTGPNSFEEECRIPMGQRLRDLEFESKAGGLVLTTDSGRLIRIQRVKS